MKAAAISEDAFDVVVGCAAVHPDQRGGQHVTMACTGVRVTHRETGIGVFVNSERSQHGNRVAAIARLRRVLEAVRPYDDAEGLRSLEVTAARDERDRALGRLAAMTDARDAACLLAEHAAANGRWVEREAAASRIAALRAVGKAPA